MRHPLSWKGSSEVRLDSYLKLVWIPASFSAPVLVSVTAMPYDNLTRPMANGSVRLVALNLGHTWNAGQFVSLLRQPGMANLQRLELPQTHATHIASIVQAVSQAALIAAPAPFHAMG